MRLGFIPKRLEMELMPAKQVSVIAGTDGSFSPQLSDEGSVGSTPTAGGLENDKSNYTDLPETKPKPKKKRVKKTRQTPLLASIGLCGMCAVVPVEVNGEVCAGCLKEVIKEAING